MSGRALRVLHVTPSFHPAGWYGGPSRSGYGLVKSLASNGAVVRVLTTDTNGPRETLDLERDVELPLVPNATVRYCARRLPESVAPSLLRVLPSWVDWCDVIHLTAIYNFTTFPTLLLARVRHKPLVWSPRGALLRWPGSRRTAAKRAWELTARPLLDRRLTRMHATSDREAEASERRMKVPAILVPNGVDLPEAWPRPARDATLRVGFLGRIDPVKAIDRLLDALALVEGASLSIAGGGNPEYQRLLEAQAATARVSSRVRFLGEVDGASKAAFFAGIDVLVLPSHTENFGLVVVEALSYGVPVIASDRTPWSSLPQEGAGWFVSNEPPALAAALREARTADLGAMSQRARALAERLYSWRHTGQEMLGHYEALVRAAGEA
ncbi:MAG: glycosyltransferase [Sandaracinaceae bacterium]|nr:glycosyltransferase [Sandaracinaceae bacterium]